MKITIELIENSTDPSISNGYKVSQGDKYADGLGYDEMIGLVSSLTVLTRNYCLGWMRTKEEHEKYWQGIEDNINARQDTSQGA